MKSTEQICFALGLAQKAGTLVSGDQGISDGLKKGKVRYVLIAAATSPRSREKLEFGCQSSHVPYGNGPDMATLGAAIGKSPRAAVAILDSHFLKLML